MTQVANALILPILGDVQVSGLTKKMIESWHRDLSIAPRRTNKKERPIVKGRGRKKVILEPPKQEPRPLSQDEIRARRNTANRVLTNLKAALNFVLDAGRVQEPAPWKRVKPFEKTSSKRIRVLTVEEQNKLIDACGDDLRPLVTAALFTGARYGELAKVLVKDFQGKTLFIEWGKGEGAIVPRYVFLTPEAIEWFKGFVEGRAGEDLMFRKTDIKRTTREELKGFDGWAPYDQVYAMEKAVEAAGIPKVTFHELRHTYASGLLNEGAPMQYVAAQLGHADSRMCEMHYGHLSRPDMERSITKHAPTLGIARSKAAEPVSKTG